MLPGEFVAKWKPFAGKETAGYASHFDDLCALVGSPTPTKADPTQQWFCFQKQVRKDSGSLGFADVYYQNHFGWEYKGVQKDLRDAYDQLLRYRGNLANPPLLIVGDFQHITIHTNFTNSVSRAYEIELDDLLTGDRIGLSGRTAMELLHAAFFNPDALDPKLTPEALTEGAASKFALLAEVLRNMPDMSQPVDPISRRRPKRYTDEQVSRFLTKVIFCMFASDVGLLPANIITRLIDSYRATAPRLAENMSALFSVMSKGGPFGADDIKHFNGGLFSDDEALWIDSSHVDLLRDADQDDWSGIEPSIFGTLFERVLDPSRRRQIGAHYTSRPDIELIVRPVLMEPLEREWATVQDEVDKLGLETYLMRNVAHQKAFDLLQSFMDRLATVTVLDPACGSGNFLYVSLALLKELEQRVVTFGASKSIVGLTPKVHPRQLHGIEIDPYAHELASMVVWIGYIQWKHKNGIPFVESPILEPLTNVVHKDAIVDLSDPGKPSEPTWPVVDVIVGNPPFLGGKLLRRGLSDEYVERMFAVWDGRVRRESDLCCYWFEKARAAIEHNQAKRAGLLATQSIRGGANRDVLRRIKESGGIYFAESDRPWILDGAAVHVSMVGFDNSAEQNRTLDGAPVVAINPNLTSALDLTKAQRLQEDIGISFMGDTKAGPFEIPDVVAQVMLASPNPDNRLNRDVVRPWVNGDDITGRPSELWIVDFWTVSSEEEAALYEAPFEYTVRIVKPARTAASEHASGSGPWWQHHRPRPAMRKAVSTLNRYIATPNLAKYRFFVWLDAATLPDHQLIAFAREDDYFFGVLHSRPHELWARATGTQLREVESGFRYTPTTCFETYPFPWRPGQEPKEDSRVIEIGAAAAELDRLRNNWLNPPADALNEEDLAKRTLTNLYNEHPTWLHNAHVRLDKAVFAAYEWPEGVSDQEVLTRLLDLNLSRPAAKGRRPVSEEG